MKFHAEIAEKERRAAHDVGQFRMVRFGRCGILDSRCGNGCGRRSGTARFGPLPVRFGRFPCIHRRVVDFPRPSSDAHHRGDKAVVFVFPFPYRSGGICRRPERHRVPLVNTKHLHCTVLKNLRSIERFPALNCQMNEYKLAK